MRKIPISLLILMIFLVSCENPFKSETDTEPPDVSITSHQPNEQYTISQVIQISCVATDRNGINKTQLWLDGAYLDGMEDKSEPYSFMWNSSERNIDGSHIYQNDEEYTLHIRAWDKNGNKKDSEPIYLTVDNSDSYPIVPQITTVNYSSGQNEIIWTKNNESDFKEYILEKSSYPNFSSPYMVFNTTDRDQASYNDFDINPFLFEYYRVTVYDTLGYFSRSSIASSIMEELPASVDITSVEYSLEEMVVEWEVSQEPDFLSYTLLKGESSEGPFDTAAVYYNQTIHSHAISTFDPTVENWFQVIVTDTFNLHAFGNSDVNEIDPPPLPVSITDVEYTINNNNVVFIQFSWEMTTENDVIGYEILYGENNHWAYIDDYSITWENAIAPDLTDSVRFNIVTIDYWGQTTMNIEGFDIINIAPEQPIIESISFDPDSLHIEWTGNSEFDFVRYRLYHGNTSEFTGLSDDIVDIIEDSLITTYTIPTPDFNLDHYFWIEVEDFWGKRSVSPAKGIFEDQDYSLPEPITLYTPYFQSGAGEGAFTLHWSMSSNPDFENYTVFVADNPEMENPVIAQYTTGGQAIIVQPQLTTSGIFAAPIDPENTYYQLYIQDQYNMSAGSNIVRYWNSEFEWSTVESGTYLFGQSNEPQMISYDYDALIYEVTNVQFVEFLRQNSDVLYFQNDGTDCQFEYIYGYYEDEYFINNLYHYISLDDSRIMYDDLTDEFGNCIDETGDFSIESGFENHPVTGVTWFGAKAFSEFNGFRLPTDEEWEKAARGNFAVNYPWGYNLNDILTTTTANYRESGDPWDDGTTPVGFYNGNNGNLNSESPFGLYDLTGNIREWTSTLDIQGTEPLPISRGGHFLIGSNLPDPLKVWYKDPLHPLVDSQNPGSNDTGFRCVKD